MRYNAIKRYVVFSLGGLIGIGILLYSILVSRETSVANNEMFRDIGFSKTGSTAIAHSIYYAPAWFKLGDFDASLLGGRYTYANGKHISKNNLLHYAGYVLPINITTASSTNYLGTTPEEKVAQYIEQFIILDPTVLQENQQEQKKIEPLSENLVEAFSLDCMVSSLRIISDFCDHNIEVFSQNFWKYDITAQFEVVSSIFKQSNDPIIRNNICQSIVHFEFLNNNPDNRFREILNSCDAQFLTTHDTLVQRNSVIKQLGTKLNPSPDKDSKRNQLKLVSSMQLIQSQIIQNKIDTSFLESYREFVNQLLKLSDIDQFSVDLIYRYHNQYLMKWLMELQKVVNLDTVQDLQNILDKFDTINNGDNLNLIGLRYRVSPNLVLATDYAQEHPPLTWGPITVITGNTSGFDASVINAVIGQVDNAIQWNMANSWSTPTPPPVEQVANETPVAQTPPQDTSPPPSTNPPSDSIPDKEEDLNTYQPQKQATMYQPENSESKARTTISDRMYNNLGIKPSTIVNKGNRYLIMRSYSNYEFAALLDRENDRKLSPVYVKIDGHLTPIPDLEMYLMDYDRYTQIKFLKSPDQYVRQATQ